MSFRRTARWLQLVQRGSPGSAGSLCRMERISSARVEQPSRLPCPHSWGYAFRAVPGDVSLSGRTLTYTALYDGYGIAVRLTVRIVLAGMGLAWAAAAQGLPPGALLLSRVKAHTREQLARLPNCSCLETVRRDEKPAGGVMGPLDTIRLEVLYSDHHELYASPGDRRFGDNNQPADFVAGGTTSNGHFALYLSEIAGEGSLSYEYKGEESLSGRRLARYDYRVPVSMSGNTITMPEGRGTTGIKGSFWADPATYDIVRINAEAAEIGRA